jgi:hypothetical protein
MRGQARLISALLTTTALPAVLGCSADPECRDLGQQACERSKACTPRVGTELRKGTLREVFAGCDSSSIVCGTGVTCAEQHETGRVARFRTTCISEWTQIAPAKCDEIIEAETGHPVSNNRDAGGEDAGHFVGDAGGLSQDEADEEWACATRGTDDCVGEDDRCWLVKASRYDESRTCFGELEPAICNAKADRTGGAAVFCRTSPDGTLWRFGGGGVVLLGWSKPETGSPQCDGQTCD